MLAELNIKLSECTLLKKRSVGLPEMDRQGVDKYFFRLPIRVLMTIPAFLKSLI